MQLNILNNLDIGLSEFHVSVTEKKIAIVILANNEARIITRIIQSVQKAIEIGDTVFVIADNCTDDTIEQATRAGALVRERMTGGSDGKGAALKWFIREEEANLEQYHLLIVLDADTSVHPEFLQQVRAGYVPGSVMQCFVQPEKYKDSSINTLIALSEIMEQKVLDRLRSRLGWSVRLRGTGMVIPPRILGRVSDRLDTEVEDIALSLLIASMGIKIIPIYQAAVLDPKPEGITMASRQRARWYKGQWKAFWIYRYAVWKLILSGPGGWSLLSSLFLKPRWLWDGILLILGVYCLWVLPVISLVCFFFLLFEIACLIYTILTAEDKKGFLKATLYFPAFMLMWLQSMLLAFRNSPWLRARE